ncbi:hypothetical protein M8868_02630 [Pasteurella multocida]|nr:hypothetical protein [Pasteurella multocida]APW56067.1 hypothetical protein PMCN07_1487 [Pasteurella multocida subsp. multocida str. HN07]ARA89777.1 hypothetical protein BTV66_09385 [Pasteurella multocida subsp. septica]ARB75675.1 hypothetical protein A6J57_05350 [Pasteurella multocida]AUL54271.1 hypothetical protein ATO47_09410 [Pasteurella multocida]EJZ77564.1 hypothetical protein P1059_01943 [Pasteurella multocida subsp. gallicida P1059]
MYRTYHDIDLDTGEETNNVYPAIDDADLKEIYLDKKIISYILGIDEYQRKENVRKETFLEQPTQKELSQEKEIEKLKKENLKLKQDVDFYRKGTNKNYNESITKIVDRVKYCVTERETHLQAICFLSFKLAECHPNPNLYFKGSGALKISQIARMLAKESAEHCITAKEMDTFHRRISEAIKEFTPEN